MPSFDVVSEANQVEIKNAVDQANKEITTRFDFKGTAAAVELKDKEITLIGDYQTIIRTIVIDSVQLNISV